MQNRGINRSSSHQHQTRILSVADVCKCFNAYINHDTIKNILKDDADYSKLSAVTTVLGEIDAIQELLKDKSYHEVSAHPSLGKLRDKCDKLSNDLCVNLMAWIASQRFRGILLSDKSFEDVLYAAALTLANLNPVNSIDFATQDLILPENKVVTSDRYQHDINSLRSWLRLKNTNPWTNVIFTARDIEAIKLLLQIKNPGELVEINEGNSYPGGDPRLADTLALVRSLQGEARPAAVRDLASYAREINRAPREVARANPHTARYLRHHNRTEAATRRLHRRVDANLRAISRSVDQPSGSSIHYVQQRRANTHTERDLDLPVLTTASTPFYWPTRYPFGGSSQTSFTSVPLPLDNSLRTLPQQILPDWYSARSVVKLPNGNWAAAFNNNNGTIHIIDRQSNQVLHVIKEQSSAEISCLTLIGDDHICAGHYLSDKDINIYQMQSRQFVKTIADTEAAFAIFNTHNGIIIQPHHINVPVKVVDIATSQIVSIVHINLEINRMLEWDGKYVLIGRDVHEQQIKLAIYDKNFNLVHKVQSQLRECSEAAILHNNRIALAHDSSHVHIFDLTTGAALHNFEIPMAFAHSTNIIRCIAELENGNIIISDSGGFINEYTQDGIHLRIARTNQNAMYSPVTLSLAYAQLVASQAFHEIPQHDAVAENTILPRPN